MSFGGLLELKPGGRAHQELAVRRERQGPRFAHLPRQLLPNADGAEPPELDPSGVEADREHVRLGGRERDHAADPLVRPHLPRPAPLRLGIRVGLRGFARRLQFGNPAAALQIEDPDPIAARREVAAVRRDAQPQADRLFTRRLRSGMRGEGQHGPHDAPRSPPRPPTAHDAPQPGQLSTPEDIVPANGSTCERSDLCRQLVYAAKVGGKLAGGRSREPRCLR